MPHPRDRARLRVGLLAFGAFGFLLLATLPVVLEIVERGAVEAAGTAAGLVWLSGQLGALVLTGIVGTVVHHPATSFTLLALATASASVALARLRGYVPAAEAVTRTGRRPTTARTEAGPRP